MANYAYVEDSQIVGVYDVLPKNWKNISNLRSLEAYPEELELLGWKVIEKIEPTYDANTHKIVSNNHYIIDGVVYEEKVLEEIIPDIPTAVNEEQLKEQAEQAAYIQWIEVRSKRDQLMRDFEWRYTRYYRNERTEIPQQDTLLDMDKYMNDLADITKQTDPFNITWPEYNNK